MINPEDIALLKRQIEEQIGGCEKALAEYQAFLQDWYSRNDPAQKRIRRFRQASGSF